MFETIQTFRILDPYLNTCIDPQFLDLFKIISSKSIDSQVIFYIKYPSLDE